MARVRSNKKINPVERDKIKKNLYDFYKASGMTQMEMARYLGYTPQYVHNVVSLHEDVLIKIENVPTWCRLLNMTPNQLFGWDDENG